MQLVYAIHVIHVPAGVWIQYWLVVYHRYLSQSSWYMVVPSVCNIMIQLYLPWYADVCVACAADLNACDHDTLVVLVSEILVTHL